MSCSGIYPYHITLLQKFFAVHSCRTFQLIAYSLAELEASYFLLPWQVRIGFLTSDISESLIVFFDLESIMLVRLTLSVIFFSCLGLYV